ncbi:CPCC family cysteine-rich protein, partial [Longimicrobium sp.]|uniref:CPCC family cysteine-rich protein n=1 Tax=Longimicrobium sp. TaxID=2029185 RepID=UPI002E322F2C
MRFDTRVQVHRTETRPGRGIFCLLGTILRGELQPGMRIAAGPGEPPPFHAAIQWMEPADEAGAEPSLIALCFPYLDEAERDRWQAIPWEGMTLEIPSDPLLYRCPCCGFRTLAGKKRGSYETCEVCGWVDDRVQFQDEN